MEMADRIAEDGFKDVGYEFVNIDVSLQLRHTQRGQDVTCLGN